MNINGDLVVMATKPKNNVFILIILSSCTLMDKTICHILKEFVLSITMDIKKIAK